MIHSGQSHNMYTYYVQKKCYYMFPSISVLIRVLLHFEPRSLVSEPAAKAVTLPVAARMQPLKSLLYLSLRSTTDFKVQE